MHVYIDESGNTGKNMFDKNQPFFTSLAAMYNGDFDIEFKDKFIEILKKLSINDIHVRKMSYEVFDDACGYIYEEIKNYDLSFSVLYVDKITHATVKMFDTIFDAGENVAVPWHAYWIREMRTILLAKFIYIVDIDTLKIFWDECLVEKNKEKAKKSFVNVLQRLKENIFEEMDARSKEIFNDSLSWGIRNIDEITYFTEDEQTRVTHLPNVAFFSSLMRNIEEQLEKYDASHCTIIHDRQTEFESAIKEMHRMFSSSNMPKFSSIPGLFGINMKMKLLEKSVCNFKESTSSYGIQLCDICLSILSKNLKGNLESENQKKMFLYITEKMKSSYVVDFKSIFDEAHMILEFLNATSFNEAELQHGKELVEFEERRRKIRMK